MASQSNSSYVSGGLCYSPCPIVQTTETEITFERQLALLIHGVMDRYNGRLTLSESGDSGTVYYELTRKPAKPLF
jgi:hypothetical protein